MPGLPSIVLLDSELPTRIVMRMGHHKDLQLLRVPLVPFIAHLPPLLPSTPIHIQELNLIIQILGRDINPSSSLVAGVNQRRLPVNGIPGLRNSGRAPLEMRGDGFGDAVTVNNEEEEEEGRHEADGEEIREDEVPESQSAARFSGELVGFGIRRRRRGWGSRRQERVAPTSTARGERHC